MIESPLAEAMRPRHFRDLVGQQDLLGRDGLLSRMIEGEHIPNLVLYGPPGTGKTTVAQLIAQRVHRPFRKLNATTAALKDVKEIAEEVGTLMAPQGVVLYLDEIQAFNKKQQQSLLDYMEQGTITLIASTTENPFFVLFDALLSRSMVFEFHPVSPQEMLPVLRRGMQWLEQREPLMIQWEEGVDLLLAQRSGGDVRKALNGLEALVKISPIQEGRRKVVTQQDAQLLGPSWAIRHDREGDLHFDLASALMKSIRGSDPDGAIYYLARLLEGGDLFSVVRRILCSACEDVGLAYPQAIAIVKACVDSALQLGMPEARIPLAQAVLLLATAPKSNSAYQAIQQAMEDVKQGGIGEIPRHLQNCHMDSCGQERGQAYLYPHDFPNHWVAQQYLPQEKQGRVYYRYGENKTEQLARRYWEAVKGTEVEDI